MVISGAGACASSTSASRAAESTRIEGQEIGDDEIICGAGINYQLEVIMHVLHYDKSTRTIFERNIHTTRTRQGTTASSSQDHHVDMDISDDESPWEENEKMMKGIRSYFFTLAASSLVWAVALVPYWNVYCSHTAMSIPKTLIDVLHIGYIFLIITIVILTAHSSQLKDDKLPHNCGSRLLRAVQVVVLLFLWAGTFVLQHVCRGVSNLVVWTCAAGALFIIVLCCALVFQYKMLIKCINAPRQMVIKVDKLQQWLPNLNLPKCINKFKKLTEVPGKPMEPF